MSAKHYLNNKEMRVEKESALHFDKFIKTLLGPSQNSNMYPPGKLTTQSWQSYKALLDRLTPSTVNQRYDELKFDINAQNEQSNFDDQKQSGYEGHDYNGIVS